LLEHLGTAAAAIPIQIFATDISEAAIERARSGTFPKAIESNVSPERLKRFFTAQDGSYRVIQPVRDLCVFARQDLTRDPPFSRLDLIVCRNVLIYLGPALQKRLMRVFHYALKPSGFLMLGQAESIGPHAQYFTPERNHKIYRKKSGSAAERGEFHLSVLARGPRPESPEPERATVSIEQLANRYVLEQYGPPGVLVDEEGMIVQTRGDVGAFLALPKGIASLNVVKMAREGLVYGLRSALQEARKTRRAALRPGISVEQENHERHIDVRVTPVEAPGAPLHFLVLFETPRSVIGPKRATGDESPQPASEQRVDELERELDASREHLQAMIQDMEAANEELQSANEEILSSNEELQSTNEELDTAREELQSTNEEINTINEELQARNDELVRVNSDLVNLLGSVRIAIVIVGRELAIRRFTPMAERVLNLIGTDVGRPIGHIKPNIDCPDLESLINEVIETVTPVERQVHDSQGVWYLLKIRPYKDLENRIDGAVLALFDVDQSRREAAAQESHDIAAAIVHAVDRPMAVLDDEGRLEAANRPFLSALGLDAAGSRERTLAELLTPRVDAAEVRAWLTRLDGAMEPEPLALPADGAQGNGYSITGRTVRRSGVGVRHVLQLARDRDGGSA
jgi:two-component system CheB/CheR fusion protein